MKRIFACLFVAGIFLFSCKKNVEAIPKLVITNVKDSVIILPGAKLQYNEIPAATYTLSNAATGTIDNTGKFTAGTSDGVYIITIVNKLNAKDTIRRMVIVTKHAAYLIV